MHCSINRWAYFWDKHPLEQLYSKRLVGLFSRVDLFSGDYSIPVCATGQILALTMLQQVNVVADLMLTDLMLVCFLPLNPIPT